MIRKLSSSAVLAILACSLSCTVNSPRTDAVDAGFFKRVGYDPSPHLLTVYFTDGSVYSYEKVPEKLYRQLLKSDSPGSFFDTAIRNNYASELIHIRTAPFAMPRLVPKIASSDPAFPCSEPSVANRKALKSVILDFAAYDAGHKCLVLYFDRGYVYQYGGVPAGIFKALIRAPAVDRFFNEQIWGKYPKRQTQKP